MVSYGKLSRKSGAVWNCNGILLSCTLKDISWSIVNLWHFHRFCVPADSLHTFSCPHEATKGFMKSSNKTAQGPPNLVVLHMDMAYHTYEDIMRITDNLNEKFLVDRGASSTVYKCTLKNGKLIAIKKLYNCHPQNVHEFETELETLGKIEHRNLVSLQGVRSLLLRIFSLMTIWITAVCGIFYMVL